MSLRGDPKQEKLEAFVSVGNYMTGLYTRIRERTNTHDEFIKKSGLARTSHKTYRDDPYFKNTIRQGDIFSSLSQARSIRPEDLNVIGMGKLSLEVDAARSSGLAMIRPDNIEKGEVEEIIAENYNQRSQAYSSKTQFRNKTS